MKRYITDITINDGEVISLGEIKPLDFFLNQCDKNSYWEVRNANKKFWKQHQNFIDLILDFLPSHQVEEYAKYTFDLVDEVEIKKQELSDFSDKEIRDYCISNDIFDFPEIPKNIIAEDIFKNMVKLFDKYSLAELDELITNAL